VSETICLSCKKLKECEPTIVSAEKKAHAVLKAAFEKLGVTSYCFTNTVLSCRRFVEAGA